MTMTTAEWAILTAAAEFPDDPDKQAAFKAMQEDLHARPAPTHDIFGQPLKRGMTFGGLPAAEAMKVLAQQRQQDAAKRFFEREAAEGRVRSAAPTQPDPQRPRSAGASMDAADLLAKDIAPMQEAVEGILPEGLGVFLSALPGHLIP